VTGVFTAAVLDAELDAAVPWLATVYLRGLTLREAIFDVRCLAVGFGAYVGRRPGEALADIHRAGLLHQDFKPGNILLTASGPRVIDFGIARSEDATAITNVGAVLGARGVMAPERAGGAVVGPAVDVFAFAAVLLDGVLPRACRRLMARPTERISLPGTEISSSALPASPGWLCPQKRTGRRLKESQSAPTNGPSSTHPTTQITA
jgi:serine/threonine protein kinase